MLFGVANIEEEGRTNVVSSKNLLLLLRGTPGKSLTHPFQNDRRLLLYVLSIHFGNFPSHKLTDRHERARMPDRMTQNAPVRKLLHKGNLIGITVKNEIVDRRNEWDRTSKGNIEMRREEEIDARATDITGNMELFGKGIVRIGSRG